jgi:F0F1-type ATP synthase assembly protein I
MDEEKKKNGSSKFARLSGIGLQMGVTIFLGSFIGKSLDDKYPSDKKWYTILFTLLFVGISLYNVLKQLNKINAEDDNSDN